MTTPRTAPEPAPLPGVETAYEFVRPSYEIVLRRVDVAEARARANLTFAGTLMFAAPAFVTATLGAGSRSFASPWFIFGAGAFACVMVCLVLQQVPQVVGEVQVISPHSLVNDGYLQAEPAVVKLNLLLWAARDWETNRRHINRQITLATAGAVFFGAQVALFAVWVVRG
jgi:hypothetical protein